MALSDRRPRASAQSGRQSLGRAYLLLEEALKLIDDYTDVPELGARLEEIIGRLRARLAEPLNPCCEQLQVDHSVDERLA
jgi:hypothetical protein